MNNSSSIFFWILLALVRNHKNHQAVLAATGMNGLNSTGMTDIIQSHTFFPFKISFWW